MPGFASAIARARAAASSDSPTQMTPAPPASRMRTRTASRSSSNAGSARWAWESIHTWRSRVAGSGPAHGGGARVRRGLGRARPLALDPEEQRRGHVDRAERADDDAERQDPGERPDHRPAEEEQRE